MDKKVRRSFILGDEWIYYKIYSGVKTADRILEEVIKPATEYLLKTNIIDQWFFIRLGDPDLHLRVRFHSTKIDNITTIIQIVHKHIQKFVSNDLIWKVQTDTYQREIERYGIHTMELSEKLFFLESKLFVNILPSFKNPDGEQQRWIFALKLIDLLLDSFEYSLENKVSLLNRLKDSFGKEFGIDRFLKSQLDVKFRNERENIEKSLNPITEQDSPVANLIDQLKSYKNDIAPIIGKILKISKKNQLEIELDNLLSSYIHMSMNRIFRNHQRMHEMVLYDFLYRYYKSKIAKRKYTSY